MARKPTNPRIQKTHTTAVFKIHNPSLKKRAMLDDCLYRYHLAFEKALKAVLDKLDEIKRLKNKRDVEARISNITNEVIKSLPLANGSKSGVAKDMVATVTSYLELQATYEKSIDGKSEVEISKMGGIPGKPTVPRIHAGEDHWIDVLNAFHYEMTLEEERSAQDELTREKTRPASFCAVSTQ